jgi:D-tyrosyl-tRNA(Tyr) deacylase
MRVVLQRVSRASVTIGSREHAAIGHGLLVLAAFEESDTTADLDWMSGKLVRLRLFSDDAGLINRSIQETGGEILIVSQFTLFGSTRKGNRPSFSRAARPEHAIPLYERFCESVAQQLGRAVASGVFGADMQVALVNDGPVTLIMDSRSRD